jgi:hypothetical protein
VCEESFDAGKNRDLIIRLLRGDNLA